MRRTPWLVCVMAISALSPIGRAQQVYLGFDRNDYPGDSAMLQLHDTHRYTSYWLNNPPGFDRNPWAGKRAFIEKQGFGFLVLFNGRLSTELKGKDATALGNQDGNAAVDSAMREGFPRNGPSYSSTRSKGGACFPSSRIPYGVG